MIAYSEIFEEKNKNIIGDTEKEFYRGKTVLVTGGGGSVGSELVRCLYTLSPSRIIIFDIYENNAFDLYCELCERGQGSADIKIEIGSVRDKKRLDALFTKYRPDIVFHAAAHKHVSLMEENCAEAVKNNCIGTYNCAVCAERYKTQKFVLVSTDKAVNPCGVMGASKRVCEMLVLGKHSADTVFTAVRFGNVFGSAGSVVPIFERQIKNGGPVTVTDKRMTRYFMSIKDAAQLLLCAGAISRGGELFVLDMGKPVNIYNLAEKMIKLIGLVPEKDIVISETGLRDGEKLYEEYLLSDKSRYEMTKNNLIYIEKCDSGLYTDESLIISKLKNALDNPLCEKDGTVIKKALSEIVPEYCPDI